MLCETVEYKEVVLAYLALQATAAARVPAAAPAVLTAPRA